jgi:hypothetical protein
VVSLKIIGCEAGLGLIWLRKLSIDRHPLVILVLNFCILLSKCWLLGWLVCLFQSFYWLVNQLYRKNALYYIHIYAQIRYRTQSFINIFEYIHIWPA